VLVSAGIGDVIIVCLRHHSAEVKRAAIIALERWLYPDDRLTAYTIEFFLALISNGVDVSPRVRGLLTSSKQQAPKPGPDITAIINNLATEIKQRPESINAEAARLRAEVESLKSSHAAEKARAEHLMTLVSRLSSRSDVQKPNAQEVVNSITSMDDLNKLEETMTARRKALMVEIQEKVICQVCLEKGKDSALSPCGHALCAACAEQIMKRNALCHICRGRVQSVTRLYL